MDAIDKSLRANVTALIVLTVLSLTIYFDVRRLNQDTEKLEVISLASELLKASFPSTRILWEEDEALEGRQDQPSPYQPGKSLLNVLGNDLTYETRGVIDVQGVGRVGFKKTPGDDDDIKRLVKGHWKLYCPEIRPSLAYFRASWSGGLLPFHEFVFSPEDSRVENFGECFTTSGWFAFLPPDIAPVQDQPLSRADVEAMAIVVSRAHQISADSAAKAYAVMLDRLRNERVQVPALGLELAVLPATLALILSGIVASVGVYAYQHETLCLAAQSQAPRPQSNDDPILTDFPARIAPTIYLHGGISALGIILSIVLDISSLLIAVALSAPLLAMICIVIAAVAQFALTASQILLFSRMFSQIVSSAKSRFGSR